MKYLNREKLTKTLQERTARDMADGRVDGTGLCVMQDGREIYKAYSGRRSYSPCVPLTEENGDGAIFRLASMTKPITAVAVLIQVSRGKLELDRPVGELLPGFRDMWVGGVREDGEVYPKEPSKKPLTLRLLLSHQNGLQTGALGGRQPVATREDRQDLAHMVDFYATLKLDFQPTEAQLYSAIAAFDVCARLVELTSGMSYQEFVTREITRPLGMKDTTFLPTGEQWGRFIAMHSRRETEEGGVSEEGITYPGCIFEDFPLTWFSGGAGLCATLPDYVRFAEMLLCGGQTSDGGRILPQELVTEMATPWVSREVMPSVERWGLGVRVITREGHWLPVSTFGWSGAYGSHFWVDPVNRITAVYMKNSRYDGGSGALTSAHFEQDVYACLE